MIIIRIQGGLGNQLFQYALYESIRARGIETKVDISDYTSGREKRAYELPKLGLSPETADRAELHRYFADNTRMLDRICRYTIGRNKYRKEKNYDFEPWIPDVKDGYLSGYWQSERYFQNVANELRRRISFGQADTASGMQYQGIAKETNSVSIHIRIGDYADTSELYGGICTIAYYKKAIAYIQENVKNPVFYVFSDTPDKVDEVLAECEYKLVEGNSGEKSYLDMYLMSQCRHHIIANSTFGWWGAWLDERTGKIVVTPSRWNNLCKGHEICCEGWVMCSP